MSTKQGETLLVISYETNYSTPAHTLLSLLILLWIGRRTTIVKRTVQFRIKLRGDKCTGRHRCPSQETAIISSVYYDCDVIILFYSRAIDLRGMCSRESSRVRMLSMFLLLGIYVHCSIYIYMYVLRTMTYRAGYICNICLRHNGHICDNFQSTFYI